jgi:hypothetical protein
MSRLYYKRYIDDIFCVFSNYTDAQLYLTLFNIFEPNIKITFNISMTHVEYLDIVVYHPNYVFTSACVNIDSHIVTNASTPYQLPTNMSINDNHTNYDSLVSDADSEIHFPNISNDSANIALHIMSLNNLKSYSHPTQLTYSSNDNIISQYNYNDLSTYFYVKLYQKPFNKFLYLSPVSCHPVGIFSKVSYYRK